MPGLTAPSTLDADQLGISPDLATARTTSTFRPDVQALRALAVVAVVIYHLFPERLPGGFVGVDVFFVISGFLITQHLVGELEATGRIALTKFWARRVRRLLPASLVVLAVSTLLVVAFMPRLTWQPNVQEIGASALYVQNWLLGFNAVDYLASQNSAGVAQHYWSLSVEEQFYLVWPLLLLGSVPVVKLVGRTSVRRAVLLGLVVVAAASFGLSLWLTADRPALAFFATPVRAWEFAAGGILSVARTIRPTPPAGQRPRPPIVGWLGVATIVCACVLLDESRPFPGAVALLPVVGALLVLAGGGSTSAPWSLTRCADVRVVQWLGDHSYSIYLWHWPLIVVAPWILLGPLGLSADLAIAALTLPLALATKRWVEDPVRRAPQWIAGRRRTYASAAAATAILLLASTGVFQGVHRSNQVQASTAMNALLTDQACFGASAIIPENGCTAPFARPKDLDLAFAARDVWSATEDCQEGREDLDLSRCQFGELDSPTRTIVVVGNSHALRLVPALEFYGRAHGWRVILAAKTDCMGLIPDFLPNQTSASCAVWTAKLQKELFAMRDLDAVVFVSHTGSQQYLAGPDATGEDIQTASMAVRRTWSSLQAHGVKVMVTEDVPGMRPESDPECIARSALNYDPCAVPRSEPVKPNLMTTLAQASPDLVTYIPVSQYFCDETLCHGLIGGVVVYTDSHHLTATMARSMARFLGPAVERAL